jgi:hypothetical protein
MVVSVCVEEAKFAHCFNVYDELIHNTRSSIKLVMKHMTNEWYRMQCSKSNNQAMPFMEKFISDPFAQK